MQSAIQSRMLQNAKIEFYSNAINLVQEFTSRNEVGTALPSNSGFKNMAFLKNQQKISGK